MNLLPDELMFHVFGFLNNRESESQMRLSCKEYNNLFSEFNTVCKKTAASGSLYTYNFDKKNKYNITPHLVNDYECEYICGDSEEVAAQSPASFDMPSIILEIQNAKFLPEFKTAALLDLTKKKSLISAKISIDMKKRPDEKYKSSTSASCIIIRVPNSIEILNIRLSELRVCIIEFQDTKGGNNNCGLRELTCTTPVMLNPGYFCFPNIDIFKSCGKNLLYICNRKEEMALRKKINYIGEL